jgi:hypothetical protein
LARGKAGKAKGNLTLAVAQGDGSATLPGPFDIAGKYHRGPKGLNSVKQLVKWHRSVADYRKSLLLFGQNQQSSECRRFLILGPRWPEGAAESGNLLPNPGPRFTECRIDSVFEVSLSNPGHGNLEGSACLREDFAVKLSFRRMN